MEYFNPRSREGSDYQATHSCRETRTFQSTLPRRERLLTLLILNPVLIISIHAPAKGATKKEKDLYNQIKHFNPRSREGSDVGVEFNHNIIGNFNPRSREGSDDTAAVERYASTEFQSTLPRRERRCSASMSERSAEISIHAPAKGATC